MRPAARTALVLLPLLVASCAAREAPPVPTIGPQDEPLREAFDAARGKVRAILLASPT